MAPESPWVGFHTSSTCVFQVWKLKLTLAHFPLLCRWYVGSIPYKGNICSCSLFAHKSKDQSLIKKMGLISSWVQNSFQIILRDVLWILSIPACAFKRLMPWTSVLRPRLKRCLLRPKYSYKNCGIYLECIYIRPYSVFHFQPKSFFDFAHVKRDFMCFDARSAPKNRSIHVGFFILFTLQIIILRSQIGVSSSRS